MPFLSGPQLLCVPWVRDAGGQGWCCRDVCSDLDGDINTILYLNHFALEITQRKHLLSPYGIEVRSTDSKSVWPRLESPFLH